MTRLRQRDLTVFSQALTTLHAEVGADSLSARILGSLRALFDCDFATFSLIDLRKGHFHAHACAPFVVGLPGVDVHQQHLHTDPAATYLRRSRRPHAVKISDFVSLREYRDLGVYTEVFGRVRCDRRLGVVARTAAPVSLVATLNRKRRDFSEEDRALLDLLCPHLLQARALTQADTRARAEHARTLAKVGDAFGAGLGEIDPAGRIRWLTPRAERLLGTFFPGPVARGARQHLPTALEKRFAPVLRRRAPGSPSHGSVKPARLVWQFAGPDARLLRVRLIAKPRSAGWQLLLEETTTAAPVRLLAQALHLTSRETEVFHWLREGKTNWEIGEILGITEKTAGKHLENIFPKLNVENRTAAVRVSLDAVARF